MYKYLYMYLYDILPLYPSYLCILYLLDTFTTSLWFKRHRDKEKTRLNLNRPFVTCYNLHTNGGRMQRLYQTDAIFRQTKLHLYKVQKYVQYDKSPVLRRVERKKKTLFSKLHLSV